jgi:hypothetical protein
MTSNRWMINSSSLFLTDLSLKRNMTMQDSEGHADRSLHLMPRPARLAYRKFWVKNLSTNYINHVGSLYVGRRIPRR